MTYTENEIETALTWPRRTLGGTPKDIDTLWTAATRTGIDGSYDLIAEKILRAHLAELSALANAKDETWGGNVAHHQSQP